jgi:tetratricopeptide (TPR) repeat protein
MSYVALILTGLMWFQPATAPAASAEDREQAAALSKQAWEIWNKQQFAEAEAKFAEAVALDPGNAGAWNGLGWCRFNLGKRSEAAEAFTKCVELNGEGAVVAARNGLGWIRWQEGDIKGAEQHWSKATDAPACWLGLAQAYLLLGRWDDAATWAEKAASQPGMGGDFAKEILEAAKKRELSDDLRVRVMPQKQSAEGESGWRLFQQGRYDDALAAFDMALEADPDDMIARNGRAWCLLNTGNVEDARVEFQTLLDHNPKHPAALNGMAVILKNEGKVDEAIELWKKMQSTAPGPNAGAYGLAMAYFEQGDYEKALPYLEMIVKQKPDDAHFTEMLERAKEELKK